MKALQNFLLHENIHRDKDFEIMMYQWRGEDDLVVFGIFLALRRSWLDLVGCMGSILLTIGKSSCSNVLVKFARRKGCDPIMVDNQGN